METMKHTPGPWIVANLVPEDNTINIRDGHNPKDRYIARVNPMPHYDDRQSANAYLIAAAPDMLKALQAAFRQTCTLHLMPDKNCKQMMADALAKVEGSKL